VRVIGSGFGRTGTLSLRAALQQLGFGPWLLAALLALAVWFALR